MTQNCMFPLKFVYEKMASFSVMMNNESWLWHHRYGHLSFSSLSHMFHKNMVKGLPSIKKEEQVYEACILGKQPREPFPIGKAWRASRPLELVQTDLCRPMRTTSKGGNRYFLTFIDDYSRKTWIYLLKEMSEAFERFKAFKALVEN